MSNKGNYGGTFCAPDERQISTIGSGYMANIISDSNVSKAGATLTNKRIYFSGSVYTLNHRGHFVSYKQRKIVNINDVTGTGYVFYRPLHYIWWAVISLVLGFLTTILINGDLSFEESPKVTMVIGFILALVFLIIYFIKRKTLLCIEYAGGNIAFDVKWIPKHEQEDFIRNVHLAKDKAYSNAAVDQGFVSKEEDPIPDL